MKSNEKRKIGKGAEMGAHTGSAILAGAPLLILLVGSAIGYVIGGGITLIAYLLKRLITKRGN